MYSADTQYDQHEPPPGHVAAPADRQLTDRRLLRGSHTRTRITRHAADVASVEGLAGLSIGRLASDLGLAKSGVQTLFGTKEKLQLATVDAARDIFIDAVVRPAQGAPAGLARLRALLDNWVVYAQTPLFPGGCFRVMNLAQFGSRPGPVRDALLRDQRNWVGAVAAEIRRAADSGEVGADIDADLAAFHIDAVLCATNVALRLDEPDSIDRARRAVAAVIGVPW